MGEKKLEKYIDLLLLKGVDCKNKKSLFISCYKDSKWFIDQLVERAKSLGVQDIYIEYEDPYETHDILKTIPLEDIKNHSYFDKKIWDEYAKKDANFLVLESEMPGLMDDIDPKKIAEARYVSIITRPIYREKQNAFVIPWCISPLPSQSWATKLFPNDKDSFNKLFNIICDMCMVNTEFPSQSWDNYLADSHKKIEQLNNLQISKLHYKNSLGTDLIIELPENALWCSVGTLGENMIVNLPSYEIFTSPNMYKTEGIVFSSKTLVYNGSVIDEFSLEFKNGKVVNCSAKKGFELLKFLLKSDEYACFLGEVALVNNDSPISNTNLVFGNTTLDENASCHLALGAGFAECIKNGEQLAPKELIKRGINPSKNHVDFMVGTPDLNITAETKVGKVLIFKNGNFNL